MAPSTGLRLSARSLIGLIGELDSTRPVYEALAERIRLLITDGRISVATRLPSERELAEWTGRSRTTIVAAYQALRDAGYVVSRRGSGSQVVLPPARDGNGVTRTIDFARAVPPPVQGLREILAEVGDRMLDALNGPGFDLLGNHALRESIAGRYRDRGLPTTADQIMVTMGAQHAISLIARTLLRRSDVALVESPTYPHAYDALKSAGARLITTPVTTDGWDVDRLVETLRTVRPVLAYLIPDFHNPTGASMPPEVRAELANVARVTGTTLVIDETTADLNIDRSWDDGPFARHAARTPSNGAGVITVGSLSKSIWGGLRLGWIRADTAIVRRLAQARPSGDLGTPQLEQLLGERIIQSMPTLLTQRRELLTSHRAVLSRLIRERLPQWVVPNPNGGLSLWVQLDRPASSAVTSLCEARGLALVAGPKFSIDGAFERYIRLPFTSPIDDLEAGVRLLAETWRDVATRDPITRQMSRMPIVV